MSKWALAHILFFGQRCTRVLTLDATAAAACMNAAMQEGCCWSWLVGNVHVSAFFCEGEQGQASRGSLAAHHLNRGGNSH